MQPYFFPYIGYFQLIKTVDTFVFYDDVNFIKKGWINRNKVLLNGQAHQITIPCSKVSQNRMIKDTKVLINHKTTDKLLKLITAAYKRAPYFYTVFPIIEEVLILEVEYISQLAEASIRIVCDYLNIGSRFRRSSKHYNNQGLKSADRLIDICKIEGLYQYINPVGGREIYAKDYFSDRGVNLSFIQPEIVPYKQFGETFISGLSIIDVLMFNSKQAITKMLNRYEIL